MPRLTCQSGTETIEAIRVEGIHAVVLGGNIHHIVHAFAGDDDTRDIQRLSVDVAVDRTRKQFAEVSHVDVRRVQISLAGDLRRCDCCRSSWSGRRSDRRHGPATMAASETYKRQNDYAAKWQMLVWAELLALIEFGRFRFAQPWPDEH